MDLDALIKKRTSAERLFTRKKKGVIQMIEDKVDPDIVGHGFAQFEDAWMDVQMSHEEYARAAGFPDDVDSWINAMEDQYRTLLTCKVTYEKKWVEAKRADDEKIDTRQITEEDDTIAIVCGETVRHFNIEDVIPDILETSFDLGTKPTVLVHSETSLVVPHTKWPSSLIPGDTYIINNTNNASKKTDRNPLEDMGELILQSWIASCAVLHIRNDGESGNCQNYLRDNVQNHFFDYIVPSLFGECKYLVAKERDANRIYIAIHGPPDLISIDNCNIEEYRDANGIALIEGNFCSAYLYIAQRFPIDKILLEFRNMDFILCGYSIGGAIASVICTTFHILKAIYNLQGIVKCITFGAPLFGDATLEKAIDSKIIYNFVCRDDPVPFLLSHIQWLYFIMADADRQISSLCDQSSSSAGDSYRERHIEQLKAKKKEYELLLDNLLSVAMPMLQTGADSHAESFDVIDPRRIVGTVNDINSSSTLHKNVYVQIGNLYVLDEKGKCMKTTELKDADLIKGATPGARNPLKTYNYCLKKLIKPVLPFQNYPAALRHPLDQTIYIPRFVTTNHDYKPVIQNVSLGQVNRGDTNFLRLSLTGLHLFEIVIQNCEFHFDFPFATNPYTTQIKKIPSDGLQRVVIESPFQDDIVMSDYGCELLYVTQLGKCSAWVRREDVRNGMLHQSVNQIACDDSASLVLERAIKRGMALSSLKSTSGDALSTIMLREIKELGVIVLGHDEMTQKHSFLDDITGDSLYIFSNEEAYAKIKDFTQCMECFLQGSLEIEAEWGVLQKIACGLITVGTAGAWMGGAILCGPSLASVAPLYGWLGVMAELGAIKVSFEWLTKTITIGGYKNAIEWITHQLLGAKREILEADTRSEISDLQDDGSVYSLEKILLLLTEDLIDDFGDCDLNHCTVRSKQIIRNKINVIQKIHNIREIFLQQCFIGIVGLQDAGKTTLLKDIWGVGENIGLFKHTEVYSLYKVTERLFVVDFPGSDSLESHATTFSNLGVMNNMVIVLIPFTGDISNVISDELEKVFSVMHGPSSTKVLLCVNKCALYLKKLKAELKQHTDPIDYLKRRYTEKLNDYYRRSGAGININENDIMFTDWEMEDEKEARNFGIVGVEGIKEYITNYLITYGIYKRDEEEELQKCISKLNI